MVWSLLCFDKKYWSKLEWYFGRLNPFTNWVWKTFQDINTEHIHENIWSMEIITQRFYVNSNFLTQAVSTL
jgi:hypothetical protein